MIEIILFAGLAAAYAAAKVLFENRLAPLEAGGDERRLADLAFACGISEFDLFKAAGVSWRFSLEKSERDFKRYLREGHIPSYVSDYVANHLKTKDRTYQTILYAGGRPPYL
jgi:hypothetical protein